MKDFEVVCPMGREPKLSDIRLAAAKALHIKPGSVIEVVDPSRADLASGALGTENASKADAVCVVTKRSIDARKGLLWRYRIEAYTRSEGWKPYAIPEYKDVHDSASVIVVGAGPAGMFAALKLLSLGLKPIVLERGKDVHERKFDMAALSRTGIVNPESNYCYGEGGAGAFSDGKLFTRSSKRGDIREVLYQLVHFGANPSILVDAHPHIGSDKLPVVVENIRKCILEHGGEYHFNCRVTDICPEAAASGRSFPLRGPLPFSGANVVLETAASGQTDAAFRYVVKTADGKEFAASKVILATGHSARDVYEMLQGHGGELEAKGFALGVRVEHPQEKINWSRYHGQWREGMPAAEYSFVEQVDGRGVFSFCMCPGGILVPSSTEEGTIVLNGMSNSARNSKWANAGVVVQIEPEDLPEKYTGPFAAMDFQHDVEKAMFEYSSSQSPENPMAAPAQRMEDFCEGRLSKTLPQTSYHPGLVNAPLHELLPPMVADRLRKAFPRVGERTIRGYYTNAALLLAVESRTSSPVRIPRDPESLEYISMPGIYPCGEGAGYAGGIVSSAIDGIRCAEKAAV